MKPERSSLNYIEVPNETWYYSKDENELYEFDEGLFRAHQRIHRTEAFHVASILKVLPKDSVIVDVKVMENQIIMSTRLPMTLPRPTKSRVKRGSIIDGMVHLYYGHGGLSRLV